MRKYFLISILSLLITTAFGQDYPRQELNFDQFVDDLFQLQDEGVNYENLYESLLQSYQNPVNLNRTSKEELASLFILSDEQINNLLEHIETNGKLLSIYELQAIEGLDKETIFKILPFVSANDAGLNADSGPLWKRILAEEASLIIRTERILEEQKGYTPGDLKSDGTLTSRYAGNPWKYYLRFRTSHVRDFSIGLTAEKDKGEEFLWDRSTKRYGMDFYSFHFLTYNKGKFKTIALGDYQLQYGQGLVLAGGFAMGKGAETINTVRRSNVGIRPYTSVIETGFFRGGAATYSLTKQVELTGFISSQQMDAARIDVDEADIDDPEFGTIQLTTFEANGLHRTESEILKKGNASKQDYGGNITYKSKNRKLQLGFSAVGTHFSDSLARSDEARNVHEFKGQDNMIYGLNYNYNWQNFQFFGEAAQSNSGGIGVVSGFASSLSRKVELAMQFRHFDPNFHSFYANAFSEGSRNINETGMYWGLKYKVNRKWMVAAYYDRFQFPWLRYRVDTPSKGEEYLGRITYKPKRSAIIYAQMKYEQKGLNQSDNFTPIDFVVPTTKKTYMINFDHNVSKVISLKSRVQWSSFQQSNAATRGYAIVQDIGFKIGRKWRINTRYAIFDTDDYDNRQYNYEKDVLYAYSVYAYNGTGTRTYVLLRYKPVKKVDVWLKLSRFSYRNNDVISSGLEEIQGARRTDLRLQVRYKF